MKCSYEMRSKSQKSLEMSPICVWKYCCFFSLMSDHILWIIELRNFIRNLGYNLTIFFEWPRSLCFENLAEFGEDKELVLLLLFLAFPVDKGSSQQKIIKFEKADLDEGDDNEEKKKKKQGPSAHVWKEVIRLLCKQWCCLSVCPGLCEVCGGVLERIGHSSVWETGEMLLRGRILGR